MESDANVSIVYTPIDTFDTADRLAELALANGYAVCVNIIRPVVAMYLWEGKIQKTQECLLIFKTLTSHVASLCKVIRQHHPYKIPVILTTPMEANSDFQKHLYACLTPHVKRDS